MEKALVRLKTLIKELSNIQKEAFVKFSLKYPPRARALAGALLDWNMANNKLTIAIAQTQFALDTTQW